MSIQRFRKLRNPQDIKLEKARLRYEMLVAEKSLMENFNSIESVFSFTSYFSRISYGYKLARQVYENIDYYMDKFMFWRKKPKKESNEE